MRPTAADDGRNKLMRNSDRGGGAQNVADLTCHPQPIRRLATAPPGTVVNLIHPDISPLAGQRKSLIST
jgi:hypothetical protein